MTRIYLVRYCIDKKVIYEECSLLSVSLDFAKEKLLNSISVTIIIQDV